jgi:hypothetical protein
VVFPAPGNPQTIAKVGLERRFTGAFRRAIKSCGTRRLTPFQPARRADQA